VGGETDTQMSDSVVDARNWAGYAGRPKKKAGVAAGGEESSQSPVQNRMSLGSLKSGRIRNADAGGVLALQNPKMRKENGLYSSGVGTNKKNRCAEKRKKRDAR